MLYFATPITLRRSMEEPQPQTDDETMCHCSGTKRSAILNLHAQGKDIHAISRWTGALSGCGGCEWDIAALLKELDEKKL